MKNRCVLDCWLDKRSSLKAQLSENNCWLQLIITSLSYYSSYSSILSSCCLLLQCVCSCPNPVHGILYLKCLFYSSSETHTSFSLSLSHTHTHTHTHFYHRLWQYIIARTKESMTYQHGDAVTQEETNPFFPIVGILTCHSRKSTGGNNHINSGSV